MNVFLENTEGSDPFTRLLYASHASSCLIVLSMPLMPLEQKTKRVSTVLQFRMIKVGDQARKQISPQLAAQTDCIEL